jgi:hypothetical protein
MKKIANDCILQKDNCICIMEEKKGAFDYVELTFQINCRACSFHPTCYVELGYGKLSALACQLCMGCVARQNVTKA